MNEYPLNLIMKLLPILTLTALLASPLCAFAGKDKKDDGVITKREAKKAAREAGATSDNPKIPKELRAPRQDGKIEKMRRLIIEGIEAGQITTEEAGVLERELSRVERQAFLYARGGKLTGAERKDVHDDLNRLNARIWAKTHNGQKPTEALSE